MIKTYQDDLAVTQRYRTTVEQAPSAEPIEYARQLARVVNRLNGGTPGGIILSNTACISGG